MESASRAISAFSMCPVRRTNIVLYHNSKLEREKKIVKMTKYHSYLGLVSFEFKDHEFKIYQSMTPDDNESFTIAPRSLKALEENPFHV